MKCCPACDMPLSKNGGCYYPECYAPKKPDTAPEVAEPVAYFLETSPGQWEQVAAAHITDPDVTPLYAHPPQPDALAELNAFIAGVEETKRPAILWEDCDFVIREGDTWFTDMQVGKDAHVKGYVIRPVEDTKADALVEENVRLRECIRCIEVEASRPTGRLVHLRRVIALHARAALAKAGAL